METCYIAHFQVTTCPVQTGVCVCEYLCGQKACKVNLGHHLTAAVPFALVCVLVVFHQVPQFGASLLVRRDHRCSRAQAVWTARSPEQALCTRKRHIMVDQALVHNVPSVKKITVCSHMSFYKFRRAAVIFHATYLKCLQKWNVPKKLHYSTQNNLSYHKEV